MPDTVLTDAEIADRFAFAIELAREAGALASGYFANIAGLTIKSKGPQDMASEADLNTELLIRDRLAGRFPDDAFMGEETGAAALDSSRGMWVVDPIDGTQPFVSGMATWCISIAFIVGTSIEIGVVFDPTANEMFAARRGHGSTLNGRTLQGHAGKSVRDGLIGMGYSLRVPPETILVPLERLLRAGGIYHRNGSGAISLCYVACGRLVGYFEPHINAWDCLAAIVIMTEAGCRVSDFLAGEGLAKGNMLLAATPAVYDELAGLVTP